MKKLKRFGSFLLASVLCLSLFVGTTSAATQQEAVDWALSQVGKSIDFDGYKGPQCVDLTMKYCNQVFGFWIGGNGCDYRDYCDNEGHKANKLPAGWTRTKYSKGDIPQPGDIIVYIPRSPGYSSMYGHVSICVSANANSYTCISQSGGMTKKVEKSSYSGVWGFIHPVYSEKGKPTVVFSNYQVRELTETSAEPYATVNATGAKVTEVGMYIGQTKDNLTKLGSDNGKAGYKKNMWYNTTKYGYPLERGTTYYYQPYAVVDGEIYKGDVKAFTTEGPSTASISLSKSSLTMKDNVCVTLNATTNPSGQAVSWKSSNNSVVRVNNGNLEGAKAGTATITASMSYNGKTYSATCNVTVTASQTVCAKHTYTSSGGDCCTVCGYQYILPKTSVDKTMYAAEDEVVVRSAPYAVSSNIVKTVKKDDAVTISYSTTNSLGNQWYITSDGLYIYADRLTTTAPAPATSTSATAQATSPAKTPDTVTFSNYQVRELTSTSAEPYATATAKTGKVARVGMYIGTDKNNLTELGTDNGTPKNYKNMWYNTTKYNYPLKPSTTYYYQPFAEVDGERYYGDIKSFTTKEPESMVTFSNYKVRNLTATSAEPYATATAKSGKVARVGMYIGTDKNNLTQLGTDNGTPKPYKNMWYNTTKYGYTIKPNTTYYYQPFAEVDGVRYYGDIKSFTTPSK